jgi:hypothetical protein
MTVMIQIVSCIIPYVALLVAVIVLFGVVRVSTGTENLPEVLQFFYYYCGKNRYRQLVIGVSLGFLLFLVVCDSVIIFFKNPIFSFS